MELEINIFILLADVGTQCVQQKSLTVSRIEEGSCLASLEPEVKS